VIASAHSEAIVILSPFQPQEIVSRTVVFHVSIEGAKSKLII